MIDKSSNFRVYLPLTLDKAGDTENGWKIKGLASTEDVDLQGEVVKQNGLDISPIKQGRGWINYNHSNDPEDMVGKLDGADLTNKGLFVEGYLFKKHKKAQNLYAIMNSLEDKDQHALKLSIEGQILKRTGKNNKVIASAKVDKVAMTFDPINTNTYVELCKAITDKNKEWNMDVAPDKDINDLDIKQPEDTGGVAKEAANDAGTSKEVSSKSLDNGLDESGARYTGAERKDEKEDIHKLLLEIKDMLSVIVGDRNEAIKSQIKSELKDMVKSAITNKLARG